MSSGWRALTWARFWPNSRTHNHGGRRGQYVAHMAPAEP
jgi:hypothetical protein